MKLSQDELLDLIDDVTIAVGEAILTNAELTESLLDQQRTADAQKKIDGLKAKTDAARIKLRKLRDTQRRRRELEKVRDKNTKAKMAKG